MDLNSVDEVQCNNKGISTVNCCLNFTHGRFEWRCVCLHACHCHFVLIVCWTRFLFYLWLESCVASQLELQLTIYSCNKTEQWLGSNRNVDGCNMKSNTDYGINWNARNQRIYYTFFLDNFFFIWIFMRWIVEPSTGNVHFHWIELNRNNWIKTSFFWELREWKIGSFLLKISLLLVKTIPLIPFTDCEQYNLHWPFAKIIQ